MIVEFGGARGRGTDRSSCSHASSLAVASTSTVFVTTCAATPRVFEQRRAPARAPG
jgi:hypothetical protein